ncbi:MAG: hypothetical protein ACTHMR_10090 [Thermomicrobiales bacterium]
MMAKQEPFQLRMTEARIAFDGGGLALTLTFAEGGVALPQGVKLIKEVTTHFEALGRALAVELTAEQPAQAVEEA